MTLRECGTQSEQEEAPQPQLPMNRMYPLNKVPQYNSQENRHCSYDADMSVRDTQPLHNAQGRFIPPQQTHPSKQVGTSGSDNHVLQQSSNKDSPSKTRIYNGPHRTIGTDPAPNPPADTGIQMSPSVPALVGAAGTQTTPPRSTQASETQTTPPNSPPRPTATGGTQTSP